MEVDLEDGDEIGLYSGTKYDPRSRVKKSGHEKCCTDMTDCVRDHHDDWFLFNEY